MSGFPILDLVIGMIFIYFILSIISSTVVEIILTAKRIRARLLEKWLLTIFDKKMKQPDGTEITLGQAIMDHCSVTALSKPGESTSYISAKNFASSLIEKITFQADPTKIVKTLGELTEALEKTTVLSTEFKRALLNYANEVKDSYEKLTIKTMGELEMFRSKIENWYDSSMERLTGPLKKHSRFFTIIIACAVAIFLNADSIAISKYLYSNPDARAKLAAKAYETSKDSTARAKLVSVKNIIAADSNIRVMDSTEQTIDEVEQIMKAKMDEVNEATAALKGAIPLGWSSSDFKGVDSWFLFILSKIFGLAFTVFAIFMGAPFWFDILNKIANLRGTGPKPKVEDDTK
jgi:hypothetical protein